MKKVLSVLLAFCLLIGCLPLAASAEETGLPKLEAPTNLEWGKEYTAHGGDGSSYMEKPGVISWKFEGLHQDKALLRIYRVSDPQPIWVAMLGIPDWSPSFDSLDAFYYLDAPSGDYYFTVQTLGDEINYASSDIITSPTWTYTRPNEQLDATFANLSWEWPEYRFECSDTTKKYQTETEMYYSTEENGKGELVFSSYSYQAYDSGIYTNKMIDWEIQEHGDGYYFFRTRAVSDDITQMCNGEWSDFSPRYNLNTITQPVKDVLSNIVSSDTSTDAEIRQAVQNVGMEALKTALLADKGEADGTADMLSKLEAKTGTTVTVAAEKGFSKIDNTGVSIVGAALNTLEQDVSEITLKLREPERENVIPTQYNNTVAIQFAMDLEGVAQPEKLAVPVKITLPVPSSINPEFLAILHYGLNGEVKETIRPYIFQESGQYYASFVLTSFSDFVMTEEKEEEPGPAVPCATLEEAVLAQAKTYGLLAYADGMAAAGNLTRLEMTKLIAGFMGAQIDTAADVTLDFSDCDDLSKADRAVINWSINQGFILGDVVEKTFRPNSSLTRAEAAVVLAYILDMRANAEYEGHFTDVEKHIEPSTWFERPINWVAEQSIFTTEGETFFPYDRAARQDVLRWLVAAYEYKNSQAVSTVTIPATASAKAGEKITLTPAIVPAINGPACVWSSSNTAVATVKNGEITGVKDGTAVITVQLANGNSAACTVTVTGSSTPVTPSTPNGGSSTPATPEPTVITNPDGSTTTTETAEDGTVTAITTWDDGKQAVSVKSPEGGASISVTAATGEKVAEVNLPAQPAEAKKFDDVKDGWYRSAVDKATGYGLFNGTTETTFGPNDPMTRGMLATVLHNLSGKPAYGTDENVFADVTANAWYQDPVDWAYKAGVVSGTSATEFSPDDNITREQLVTMLYNYAGKIGAGSGGRAVLTGFPDAGKVSGYAQTPMQWAVAEGFISGRAEGGKNHIAPKGTASRAEVAAVLTKFVEYLKK